MCAGQSPDRTRPFIAWLNWSEHVRERHAGAPCCARFALSPRGWIGGPVRLSPSFSQTIPIIPRGPLLACGTRISAQCTHTMQALSSKVAAASTLAQKAVAAPRSRKSVSVRAAAAPTTTKLNTKRSEEVRATHCAGQGHNPVWFRAPGARASGTACIVEVQLAPPPSLPRPGQPSPPSCPLRSTLHRLPADLQGGPGPAARRRQLPRACFQERGRPAHCV